MRKKILILIVSLMGTYLLYILFFSKSIDLCDIYCNPALGYYHKSLLFFPFILFFSLLTFKLPDPVFARWYRFTIYTAPVILLISFSINLGWHHTNGGFFNSSALLDIPAQILLYTLYTVGSGVTIWRAYLQR